MMQQEQFKIKVELTPAEMELVLNALSFRPWREVNDLIIKLTNEYNKQLQSVMAAKVDKDVSSETKQGD